MDTKRISSKLLATALLSILGVGGLEYLAPSKSANATTGCTAGSVSTDSSNSPVIVVTFTAGASTAGDCTWTVPNNVFTVDYLVVAGGGGGASGGGGGGGVVTSFGTTNADNTTNSASTPQAVTPGDDIAISVGLGGAGGAGGWVRYNGAAQTIHEALPSNGGNSSFGSITATGGGSGGHRESGGTGVRSGAGATGGSSGGDSFDRSTTGGSVAASSTVVGAQSFGNDGGGSPGGSYSAGGGGGGAGAAGGNARQLSSGCGAENCTANYHGGGNGGRGIRSSITGTTIEYGCGGGGGVNSNNNVIVTNGGGAAGCASAGVGSRYGNLYNNYTATSATNAANATSGSASRGGGGGGTDPEDTRGGAGGSGVVILRYSLVDANCPNNSGANITAPVACPANLTVSADGVSEDIVMRGSPVSYASSSATMTVLNTPAANPTSGNMSVTVVSGGTLRVSVPSGSSLIGGTYPVTYRLSENSNTSDSYLMVTVDDPDVEVPEEIPVDPRAESADLPSFLLGSSTNVLVCVIQTSDSHGNVTVSGGSGSGVTRTSVTRGVTLRGSRANVSSALGSLLVEKASADDSLVPNGDSRVIRLTISNTDNGGNGSCNNGTIRSVTIRALELEKSAIYDLFLNN